MDLYIQLENGDLFKGQGIGRASGLVTGTCLPFTGMTGYQEAITDPANQGKILVFTQAMTGVYGLNMEDREADRPQVQALVSRTVIENPSHFMCEMDLDSYLAYYGTCGLREVDTRSLARVLFKEGPMRAVISPRPLTPSQIKEALEAPQAYELRCEKEYLPGPGPRLGVWDLGAKKSLLAYLKEEGFYLVLIPFDAGLEYIQDLKLDGLLVTSGPLEPDKGRSETLKVLSQEVPVFGLGLGALDLASGLGGTLVPLRGASASPSLAIRDRVSSRVYQVNTNTLWGIKSLGLGLKRTQESLDSSLIQGFEGRGGDLVGTLFDPLGHPGSDELKGILKTWLARMEGEDKDEE